MKYTVIESERIVVYLSKYDDKENTIWLEALPKCQIRLNSAVEKFVDYLSTFEDVKISDFADRLDFLADRMKYFICNFDSIYFSNNRFSNRFVKNREIAKITDRITLWDNTFAEFCFTNDGDFEKLFNLCIANYGMTGMGFIFCDVVTLAQKACEYIDLWDDTSENVVRHKELYYGN